MVEIHKKEKTLSGQDKLLVDEWQKRMARKEKDRRAQEDWDEAWMAYVIDESKKEKKKPKKMKEETEAAEGDDKDEDEDYHPSKDAGDASSQDPTYEPSKKELKRSDKEGDQ